MIKEYLSSLDNIKDRTKKDYLVCIKGIIDIAMDAEIINKNVAANITFKACKNLFIHFGKSRFPYCLRSQM